jgi:hypothetical protein
MVGDSITDVQTARAGGAPVILVSYGYTPQPARTLGADAGRGCGGGRFPGGSGGSAADSRSRLSDELDAYPAPVL